jgi:hypothetical protein
MSNEVEIPGLGEKQEERAIVRHAAAVRADFDGELVGVECIKCGEYFQMSPDDLVERLAYRRKLGLPAGAKCRACL